MNIFFIYLFFMIFALIIVLITLPTIIAREIERKQHERRKRDHKA